MPDLSARTSHHADVHTIRSTTIGQLPPAGSTPAGDLQRKLARAALVGFYAPKRTSLWGVKRRIGFMIITGALGWGTVFGCWATLTH